KSEESTVYKGSDQLFQELFSRQIQHLYKRLTKQEGLFKWRVIIDPGLGFGKSGSFNWIVVRQLHVWGKRLGCSPICLGYSRKRFMCDNGARSRADDEDTAKFGETVIRPLVKQLTAPLILRL